ncbi:hypothetical protein JAAARDRAFT_38069 [Jaapia argillacea MUCL 33604]|uniref:protein-tyrosine-phosphatase n=1 Tax=Jaapia argillacea MUCL 33604 TaxID=933084 RepID=A0A067PUL7_9AGAM|nr:hypothetical protein JAAARDRAFT_38069 [Jaapia argillacea MUCL 33604]
MAPDANDFFSAVPDDSVSAHDDDSSFAQALAQRFGDQNPLLTARLKSPHLIAVPQLSNADSATATHMVLPLRPPPSSSPSRPSGPTVPAISPSAFRSVNPAALDALLHPDSPSNILLLDIRPHAAYSSARIHTALSLSVPSTLLKRPLFSLARLSAMLPSKSSRNAFAKWKDVDKVVIYDADSTALREGGNLLGLMRKFVGEGRHVDDVLWVTGGFQAVWRDRRSWIDQDEFREEDDDEDSPVEEETRVEGGTPSSSAPPSIPITLHSTLSTVNPTPVLRTRNLPIRDSIQGGPQTSFPLSLSSRAQSLPTRSTPASLPLATTASLPAATQQAYNPFFDTIRQNLELSQGVTERIPLVVSRRVKRGVGRLPREWGWLRGLGGGAGVVSGQGSESGTEEEEDVDMGDDSLNSSRDRADKHILPTTNKPVSTTKPTVTSQRPVTTAQIDELTESLAMQFYRIELAEQRRLMGIMEHHSKESFGGKGVGEGKGLGRGVEATGGKEGKGSQGKGKQSEGKEEGSSLPPTRPPSIPPGMMTFGVGTKPVPMKWATPPPDSEEMSGSWSGVDSREGSVVGSGRVHSTRDSLDVPSRSSDVPSIRDSFDLHSTRDSFDVHSTRDSSDIPPRRSPDLPSTQDASERDVEAGEASSADADEGDEGQHTQQTVFPYSITAGVEKGTKNRYRNIWPFEHARVRLLQPSTATSSASGGTLLRPRSTSSISSHLKHPHYPTFPLPPSSLPLQAIREEGTGNDSTTSGSSSTVTAGRGVGKGKWRVEEGTEYDDYVNASYVQPLGTKKRYIATQGPLEATFADFWTLCWEQNVHVIVMLTREVEGMMEKCGKYWREAEYGPIKLKVLESSGTPEDENWDFFGGRGGGDKSIEKEFFPTLAAEEGGKGKEKGGDGKKGKKKDLVRRVFELTNMRYPDAGSRRVTQFQYLEWPDMNVPDDPRGVLDLVREVEKEVERLNDVKKAEEAKRREGVNGGRESGVVRHALDVQDQPLLLHCSAGVGRTGGFIVVDAVLDGLRRELRKMREEKDREEEEEEEEEDDGMDVDVDVDGGDGKPPLPLPHVQESAKGLVAPVPVHPAPQSSMKWKSAEAEGVTPTPTRDDSMESLLGDGGDRDVPMDVDQESLHKAPSPQPSTHTWFTSSREDSAPPHSAYEGSIEASSSCESNIPSISPSGPPSRSPRGSFAVPSSTSPTSSSSDNIVRIFPSMLISGGNGANLSAPSLAAQVGATPNQLSQPQTTRSFIQEGDTRLRTYSAPTGPSVNVTPRLPHEYQTNPRSTGLARDTTVSGASSGSESPGGSESWRRGSSSGPDMPLQVSLGHPRNLDLLLLSYDILYAYYSDLVRLQDSTHSSSSSLFMSNDPRRRGFSDYASTPLSSSFSGGHGPKTLASAFGSELPDLSVESKESKNSRSGTGATNGATNGDSNGNSSKTAKEGAKVGDTGDGKGVRKPGNSSIDAADAPSFFKSMTFDYTQPRKLHQADSPPPLSSYVEPIRAIVEDMREQRMSLCQSLRQYVFVHRAIIEGAIQLVDEDEAAAREKRKGKRERMDSEPPERMGLAKPENVPPTQSNPSTSGTGSGSGSGSGSASTVGHQSAALLVPVSPSKGKRHASPTDLFKESSEGQGRLAKRPSLKRKKGSSDNAAVFDIPLPRPSSPSPLSSNNFSSFGSA